ncbi:hypothetical protein [Haloferax sp. DFSO52]
MFATDSNDERTHNYNERTHDHDEPTHNRPQHRDDYLNTTRTIPHV